MGNKATGGPFAPLVVVVRNAMGAKEFNMFRGKAISLHSQGEKRRREEKKRRKRRRETPNPRPNPRTHSPPPSAPLSLSPSPSVIKEFGKSIGADTKQVQGLIRLAKKNGEKLGFLA